MALDYTTTQQQAKDAAFERLLRESTPRMPAGASVPRDDLEIVANAIGDGTASLLRDLLVVGLGGGGGGGAGSVTQVSTGDGLSGGPITTTGTLSVDGTVARWGAGLTATRVPFMGGSGALSDAASFTFNSGTGTLTASAFSGSGAALTNLTAANIAAGTAGINISGNAATVTNGVYTSTTYSDPGFITALAGSKISGNISGNAANVTGTVAVANGGTGATGFTATRLLFMGGAGAVTDSASLTFNSGTGALTATSFVGSGAALTGLTVRSPLVGTIAVTSSTDVIPWGGELAASDYPTGRDITLSATGTVTRAGLTGSVVLYNLTADTATATLSFTWTGSAAPATQTASVTLSGTATYELRVSVTGYSAAPDALQLYVAELVVR